MFFFNPHSIRCNVAYQHTSVNQDRKQTSYANKRHMQVIDKRVPLIFFYFIEGFFCSQPG